MRMASMRESRDNDRFLVNTQVQSHALLRRGFSTSVPFIRYGNPRRSCPSLDMATQEEAARSTYNHNTLTTLRTPVKESLQMHFKVAIRSFHALNANR